MSTVGIIANPDAGKDIRRLVAHGRVVSNQEKSNILRRVFAGIAAMGAERILIMPDGAGLTLAARNDTGDAIRADMLDMLPADTQQQTTHAARLMAEAGAGSIVTLGGDGTNRVAARGCGRVPLVAISTGTNNVFPQMIEGTLAGMAAGAVATGRVSPDQVCRRSKRLEIFINGSLADIALVDAAVSREQFAGARAVWKIDTLQEIFLTRAEPASIGLSSIGSRLQPLSMDAPSGMHLRLAGVDDRAVATVQAPVGPGVVTDVRIASWRLLEPGDRSLVTLRPGMIALDGEREVTLLPRSSVEIGISLDGPRLVQVDRAMELIARGA